MSLARYPALVLGMVASVIQVGSGLFLDLTVAQTSLINAAVVAILGAVTAWLVKGDALVGALVGVGQALLALMIGFGLVLSPELQASIMALVSAAAAAYVHTQVVAPVPPQPGSSPLEPTVVPPPPPL
jgi:hypothetical protein